MAVTQKRLYLSGQPSPNQVALTPNVYYRVPTATTTIVKQIILTNTTASSKVVYVALKPLGVAFSGSNAQDILSGVTLAANETLSFSCSIVMENNGSASSETNSDELRAWASASGVNITITGIEES